MGLNMSRRNLHCWTTATTVLCIFYLQLACGGFYSDYLVHEVTASDFFSNVATTTNLPQLPKHQPSFSVRLEMVPLSGSNGTYLLPVHVIRDVAASGVVVATFTERTSFLVQTNGSAMGELNLLAPTPSLAPLSLPKLERYGWAWLYGAKATTVTWLDCCGVTGDANGVSLTTSFDNQSVLLSQWQSWQPNGKFKGRNALSVHNFTLFWDPIYGYSIDASLRLRINAAAAPKRVEFLNFLTPHLMNPWPDANLFPWLVPPAGAPPPWPITRPTVTAWANDSAGLGWTGFADNLLAGAELGTYALPAPAGGVIMATPQGLSPAIAYGLPAGSPAGNATMWQATCPTWGDQHQMLQLPASPNPDGFFDVTPTFSIRWCPPRLSEYVLDHLALLHSNETAVISSPNRLSVPLSSAALQSPPVPLRWLNSSMLRVGSVETFEDQPIALTRPVRALVESHNSPDYVIVHHPGVGVNGSSAAWLVPARPEGEAHSDVYAFANQQPLIPLNASTAYSFSAWARLLPNASLSTLAGRGRNGAHANAHHQAPTPDAPASSLADGASLQALLWAGVWEADDFNQGIGPGPSYGRLMYMNSSVLTTFGGQPMLRGASQLWSALSPDRSAQLHPELSRSTMESSGDWAKLVIAFTSPPWPSYVDLRAFCFGGNDDAALFDDWAFVVMDSQL